MSDVIPVEMRKKYRLGEYKEQYLSVYNPLSVVKAVTTGMVQNYWNKTENYEALAEYIRMDYDGLKDTVALLINLGYLSYDVGTRKAFIPNREILDEFKASTKSTEWAGVFQAFRKSQELLEATWARNESRVATLLEWFYDHAENKTYHSEAALSYAVQLAYYTAQRYYTTIQELDTGKGYADVVYLPSPKYPDKPALLVELKYGKTFRTAADQIRDRDYPQKLEHYQGNLLLVCVNYDKDAGSTDEEYKRHQCRIEKY